MVATTPLSIPENDVDLATWLHGLDDAGYRASSRAHLGFGHTPGGATAVEALGGAFIVNHHVIEHAAPHAFRLRSRATRAYLLRLVPIRLDLTWEMAVRPGGRLECALTVALPAALDRVGEPFLRPVLQRHADEETPGFAADIARRQGGR